MNHENQTLRFFHGTTSSKAEKICTEGLPPMKETQSAFRGNLSYIPGYSNKLIFLAPSIEEAAFYAKRNAEYDGSSPVIYEVLVTDQSQLRVSDDYILNQARQAMIETAGIRGPEYDDDGDLHQYGESTEIILGWRDIASANVHAMLGDKPFNLGEMKLRRDATIDSIEQFLLDNGQSSKASAIWIAMCQAAREAFTSNWKMSIATDRDPAVGHNGIIHLQHLRPVDQKHTLRAIANCRRGHGKPTTWDLSPPTDSPHVDIKPRRMRLR